MMNDEMPVLVLPCIEVIDRLRRGGVDFPGNPLRQVARQPQGGVRAGARSHQVDPGCREAAGQVVEQSLHALIALGRVGRDGQKVVIDDERSRPEQEIAPESVGEFAADQARVHVAAPAGEQDDDLAGRQIDVIQDVENALPVPVGRRRDEVFGNSVSSGISVTCSGYGEHSW